MQSTLPRVNKLSASSIAAFKACPTRYRLGYVEGLRPIQDTESQRIGTNWHEMHETYAAALEAWKTDESESENAQRSDQDEYALQAVVTLLNDRYSGMPISKTPFEWALERQILLTSFIGYLWYWQNDPVEVIASEVPFELPIHMPRTGLPLPTSEVLRVGKIDHIIRWQGAVCALERKSTSRQIGPDSDYWDRAKKDTQVSMYALAFRDLIQKKARTDRGQPFVKVIYFDQLFEGIGLEDCRYIAWDQSERVGNTLYDVWHKPTIKPSMLTQKETAEFIRSREYCGQCFEAEWKQENPHDPTPTSMIVNGASVEIEPGKKGFAIKETIDMFGARLLQDIQQRPDFYFQRREIARTDAEIREFRQQLFAVYQAQKSFQKSGCWFENEQQCRATFTCQYVPICYGPGADSVCDGKTVPDGFKRIFVDLTVNGVSTED